MTTRLIAQPATIQKLEPISLIGDSNKLPVCNCESVKEELQHAFKYGSANLHWERTISLPDTGRFVEESHYVTMQDSFPDGRLFAETDTERISIHLERSLKLFQQYDSTATLEQLYHHKWQQIWTPAEHGHIGQGAIGDRQRELLTPETELWLLTMMWATGTRPEPGTKFLLEANERSVVVVAGFETGPGREQYLGGVTPEVHAWLGTDNNSRIKVSLLRDQQVPIGPVRCSRQPGISTHSTPD